MAHYNPFQNYELRFPEIYREQVNAYCQTQPGGGPKPSPDDSPFPRQVDLWFFAACIGAKKKEWEKVKVRKWHKFETGVRLASEPHMIEFLELIAISLTEDAWIIEKPGEIINLANRLAASGLPDIIEMIRDGNDQSIWNLTDHVMENFSSQYP